VATKTKSESEWVGNARTVGIKYPRHILFSMRGSTRSESEAQYPIDSSRFTTWAEQRGATVTEEDGQIVAEWDENTSITMGDGRISCWKPYKSHLRSALEIVKVSPEEESLSHTGAGKGELDSVSIRGTNCVSNRPTLATSTSTL